MSEVVINPTKTEDYATLHSQKTGDECGNAIESIQIALVRSGGKYINKQKIIDMTVKELAILMTNNFIAANYMKDK